MATRLVTWFVVAAILLMLVAGLGSGLDPVSVVILGGIVAVGALAVAVTRKKEAVAPASCSQCRRVISRSAPYCKHCGTRVA